MRNALARTLYELAKADDRIVVVVADISPAGAMEDFRREFPDRFINVGVAEASMIALAAGMAQRGFKVFCYTIATFALFRCLEQIRVDLAYQNLPVTVVGMGAGLAYSTLGATHQAVEDVAVACAMPNMTVLAPCDPAETEACARWCASRESGGPVYMRIGKAGEPDLTSGLAAWQPGELLWLIRHQLARTCILTYGPIASVAVEVARRLRADALSVSTVCPLPASIKSDLMLDYNHIVVIEEASGAPLAAQVKAIAADVNGGRWEDDPSLSVESFALPREFCHIHGTHAGLLEHYGLTVGKIIAALA